MIAYDVFLLVVEERSEDLPEGRAGHRSDQQAGRPHRVDDGGVARPPVHSPERGFQEALELTWLCIWSRSVFLISLSLFEFRLSVRSTVSSVRDMWDSSLMREVIFPVWISYVKNSVGFSLIGFINSSLKWLAFLYPQVVVELQETARLSKSNARAGEMLRGTMCSMWLLSVFTGLSQ